MPEGMIKVYADPPQSPDECVFAQTTTCVSADFEHRIAPCQFGGNPDCSQLRLHRLGRARRHRAASPAGRACGSGAIFETLAARSAAVRFAPDASPSEREPRRLH